eukprot:3209995-Heterocapsa_arctica.AAC.1
MVRTCCWCGGRHWDGSCSKNPKNASSSTTTPTRTTITVKGKGKSKSKKEEFQGFCKRCGRWGHKRNDCYATIHMLAEEIPVPEEDEDEEQEHGEDEPTYYYNEDEVGV